MNSLADSTEGIEPVATSSSMGNDHSGVHSTYTSDLTLDRVNAGNIYANLGGPSSSEEDNVEGSDDSEGGNTKDNRVVKTVRTKVKEKMGTSKQAFLAPNYDMVTNEEPKRSSFKFQCQRFKKNNCGAGSMCLFSHDLDTIPISKTDRNTSVKPAEKGKTAVYEGVMYDLESGCHQASVEAQGRYICVGYFAEPMEAARARDIGMIRMIGIESAKTRLCLDIVNYETIDLIELRSYDELLEDSGAELVELSDDSANMFGY